MADHDILLQFLDNDALSYLDRLADASENAGRKMVTAQSDSTEALKKATDQTEKLSDADKSLEDAAKKAKKAQDEQKDSTDKLGDSVEKAAGQINVMGVNLGSVIKNLKAKKTELAGVARGLGGATRGLKAFRVALASTGIGLILVALGSLVTYLTKTQEGMDKVNVVLARVKGGFDAVIQTVADFGGGLAKLFQGKWKEGFNEIKDAVSGMGDAVRDTSKGYAELEKRSQKLKDAQNELIVREAELLKQRDELREQSRQEGVSIEERTRLLEQVSGIENKLASERLDVAKEELAILKERNSFTDSSREDKQREAELEAQVMGIERERARNNRRWIQEIKGLRKTANNEAEAANKARLEQLEAEAGRLNELETAFRDLYRTIQSEMHSLEREFMTPGQLIADDERIALESIDRLFEETARAYKEAYGEELDVTEQMEEAKMLVRRKYAEQRKKLEKGILDRIAKAEKDELKDLIEDIELDLDETGFVDKFVPENFVQAIQERLKEAYNLDDDDIASIGHSLTSLFYSFSGAFGDSVQRQLDENQRLMDAIQQRRDEAQRSLDDEIEAMEAGYAHDIEAREKYYQSILDQEQQLEQERAQLLERQRRQQVAQESLQQVAAIGTAVANFFASGAKFGPVIGLALASTAIAGMFSIIRAAKSQAQDTVRMYEGGFVNKHGSNDQYGKGYRVEGTNKVIGGNEFLVKQSLALKDQEFLEAYNSGRLNWIDLNQLARGNIRQFEPVTAVLPNVGIRTKEIAGKNISMRSEVRAALNDVLPELFGNNSHEITSAINRRREYFEKDGDLYEYTQGKMKRIIRL